MAYEFIIAERLDGVALITLNRPEKLNALSFPLMTEVDHALTEYEADEAIKAVMLTGAINGLAYGGAALLSSSLDIRIGCEKSQFRFLAASYGRVNSTWSLPALVGMPKAKELLFTGRAVAVEEAERIGLLNQVVPSAKLIESAVEMGQMIAKNDARMVQGIKRLLHEGMGMDWQGRYDLEDEARATWLSAGHPRDGFKDFLARKPAQ